VSKRKVAVACQGGGSHAAFAAGVLLELLRDPRDIEIVGLSGTSGGAMCAALAWRGLVASGADEASRRLAGFWRDLEATDPIDGFVNFWGVWLARFPVTVDMTPYLGEPGAEPRLRELLHRHLELDALTDDVDARSRLKLLVGATDVLAGQRLIFSGETLTVDQLVASAAVPPLFRAVHAGPHVCWDGLFTTNPPVREFTGLQDRTPEEIWVVQINPQRRATEPRSVVEIKDRNNELSGNLSLSQELFFIDKINQLRAEHPTLADRYKHITVRLVELGLDSNSGAEALDYPSKLDRDSAFIERLLDAGRERAGWFFEQRSLWPRPEALAAANVVVSIEREQRRSEPAPLTEPSRPIARPGRSSAGASRGIEESARSAAKAAASPEPKAISDASPVPEVLRTVLESSAAVSEPTRSKAPGSRTPNRAERRARKGPRGGSGPASR